MAKRGARSVQRRTSGEDLFLTVKNDVLSSLGRDGWNLLKEGLGTIEGSGGLHAYLVGATTVHVVRKLLRSWKHEMQTVSSEYGVRMAISITRDAFPGLDRDLSARLGRILSRAGDACDHDVASGTRALVLGGTSSHHCYLCGIGLSRHVTPNAGRLTLEHLWPRSLGGESDPFNLLPACEKCQQTKADALSWEWINVHNLVLSPGPSDEALKAVPWSMRIARHYMHVMSLAERSRSSLLSTFRQVGPINPQLRHTTTGPVTFFDLETV